MKFQKKYKKYLVVASILFCGLNASQMISKAATSNSSYTIVAPPSSLNPWGSGFTAYQVKAKHNTNAYAYLSSSTNYRRIAFQSSSSNANYTPYSSYIVPKKSVTIRMGNASQVAGKRYGIAAKAHGTDAGILNTTARGSWRNN